MCEAVQAMSAKLYPDEMPDDKYMIRLLEAEGFDPNGVREFADILRRGISSGAVPDFSVGHFVYGLYLGSYLVRTYG
jgi:predicted Zn-dependent protease